ncbi:hypothetical protein RFI_22351 [Reticulomyxa filosa]|uniref:Uncharacterized protein n=1 Tax=Reticulomyxa filosa TaxID=46433 RepID=X6MMY2_RETFI|nr:hypothetical protein RFI_22351 [Reticulomyxa filosa]|eukprot:ETO15016.1 hypothetical protein RFI_22351 [Reticulomyxa filosa]
MAILIYHSYLMKKYTWFVWLVIWGQIAVNVAFLVTEMWWWGYKIYCYWKNKDPEDLKRYWKDIANQWDTNNPVTVKERQNKGYRFLKQIESLSDKSGESGLKKRKNAKKNKNNEEVKSLKEESKEKVPDDDEFDDVELEPPQ